MKEGKTPQKMEMKKNRPRRSCMSRMSECHHISPARIAAVITWKTLRVLKDSCLRSLRLLRRRIANWFDHVVRQVIGVGCFDDWISSDESFVGFVAVVLVLVGVGSVHAAFTFGAMCVLYEFISVYLTFWLSLSLAAISEWLTPETKFNKKIYNINHYRINLSKYSETLW